MFITVKRHEREKQDLLGSSNRLSDAILKKSDQGLFLLDAKDRIQPQVSRALGVLFNRQDFHNLSFEKLLAPVVSVKTLTRVRNHMAALFAGAPIEGAIGTNALKDIEVRLTKADGTTQTAHYWFDFDAVNLPDEPHSWLVRVTDITMQVETLRELEDLRSQTLTQGEILRGVLHRGGARFGAFLSKTDKAMKTIGTVLKKSARAEDAFRSKLEETLEEVDRIRREAAAFKLSALEQAARHFEEALQEVRSRTALSGSDFLPLAVKLDHLYSQFALVKSFTVNVTGAAAEATGATVEPTASPRAHRSAPAGTLDNTLQALMDHVADEQKKEVVLETHGLHLVPARYAATIKNVSIQLIRNAVMHGIEGPAVREAAGKALHGTLRLDFRLNEDNFELLFEDDGAGLDPDRVRQIAVERGIISNESATRLRDREAIKLIFKSRFTTLAGSPGDTTHGSGMSLVRRYVHEAGGKIALASLPGHETRFKITLPLLAADPAAEPVEVPADSKVA